jgi:hypothetical protein
MDQTLRRMIVALLDDHGLITVATNGPDAWPETTTVGCVNDGLTLDFLCRPESQGRRTSRRITGCR